MKLDEAVSLVAQHKLSIFRKAREEAKKPWVSRRHVDGLRRLSRALNRVKNAALEHAEFQRKLALHARQLVAAPELHALGGVRDATLDEQRRYGKAIKTLREKHQLLARDIVGVRPLELARAEKGVGWPSAHVLKQLAAAHKMEPNQYLDVLAAMTSTQPNTKPVLWRGLAAANDSRLYKVKYVYAPRRGPGDGPGICGELVVRANSASHAMNQARDEVQNHMKGRFFRRVLEVRVAPRGWRSWVGKGRLVFP